MTYITRNANGAIVALTAAFCLLLSAAVRPALADPSSYVFAVTWHAAFCETEPGLPECADQDEGDFSADRFALHGLWPQPYGNFYCGVDDEVKRNDLNGSWAKLPPLQLPANLAERLSAAMPGTESHLDRHQWFKHGTCHEAADQSVYFEHALRLLDELNQSAVRDAFASNIGDRLNVRDIRTAFDRSFGEGAGARVALECETVDGRELIVELRISLTSPVGDQGLRRLMDRASDRHSSCTSGIVDAPGPG